MFTTVIIDDEIDAISTLQKLLNKHCHDVKIVGTASNALEGIKEIQKNKPDLIFLDIQMPNGSGFDVLEAFPKKTFQVVFTTAHQQHAIKAIKLNALDYLLKPIDLDELKTVVEKAISQTVNNSGIIPKEKILTLRTINGFLITKIKDILYCKADGSYVHFYFLNGNNCVVSGQLTEFLPMLTSNHFFRIHNTYLVNLEHIKEYSKKGSRVLLSDESYLPVSVRKRADFFKAIQSLGQ